MASLCLMPATLIAAAATVLCGAMLRFMSSCSLGSWQAWASSRLGVPCQHSPSHNRLVLVQPCGGLTQPGVAHQLQTGCVGPLARVVYYWYRLVQVLCTQHMVHMLCTMQLVLCCNVPALPAVGAQDNTCTPSQMHWSRKGEMSSCSSGC